MRAWCGGAPPTPAGRCGCSRPGPAPRRRCHSSRTPRQARARAAARCGRHGLCRSLTASPEPCTASGLYHWFTYAPLSTVCSISRGTRGIVLFLMLPNIKIGEVVFSNGRLCFQKRRTAFAFSLLGLGLYISYIWDLFQSRWYEYPPVRPCRSRP